MKNCRVSICVLLATVPFQLFATDLSLLDTGRNVRFVLVGQGPLCGAKVVTPSSAVVTLKLSKTTPDCGRKDQLIYLSQENVVELVPQRRLTQRRIFAKVLLGFAGVAALAAIPLTSSDPESLLILGNFAGPAMVLYGAWRAIPRRLDYLVMMTCPDRQHCLSASDPRVKMPGPNVPETPER